MNLKMLLKENKKMCLIAVLALVSFFLLTTILQSAFNLGHSFTFKNNFAFSLISTGIFVFSIIVIMQTKIFKEKQLFSIFLCFTAFALFIRFAMFDIASGDYNDFLVYWVADLKSYSGIGGLAQEIGDYNVPYMFILWIISKFPLSDLYLIKFVSVLFDIILAYYVSKLVFLVVKDIKIQLISFFAVMYLPTVISNSAWWAQCDSIYTAFALGGIYYFLEHKGFKGAIMFALSLCFKLQAIFVYPLLIIFLILGNAKIRHILVMPIVYLVTITPALIAGRSFENVFSIYFSQMDTYNNLTLNCPNVYSLFTGFDDGRLGNAGMIATIAFIVLIILLLVNNRRKLDNTIILNAAFITSFGMVILLPHMHERYSFISDILILVMAFLNRKKIKTAIILQVCSLFSYLPFIAGSYPINFEYLAIIRIGILLYSVYELYFDLSQKSSKVMTKV